MREPEEIAGKETISAPDLGPGDFVEWETVEYREPEPRPRARASSAIASTSSRSSCRCTCPSTGAGARRRWRWSSTPAPAPRPPRSGTARRRDAAATASWPARCRSCSPSRPRWRTSSGSRRCASSSGVTVERWARMLADGLFGLARSSPALRERWPSGWWRASTAGNTAGRGDRPLGPRAHRGRGQPGRAGHRHAGPRARQPGRADRGPGPRARPGGRAGPGPPADRRRPPIRRPVRQELDDFAEVLVRFAGAGPGAAARYVDPRWKHAAVRLPAAGARRRSLPVAAGRAGSRRARSRSRRRRARCTCELRLEPDGSGEGEVARDPARLARDRVGRGPRTAARATRASCARTSSSAG